MKILLHTLRVGLLLLAFAALPAAVCAGRKKAPQPEVAPTRYEKLFRNKQVTTARGGLMTLHLIDGKLYLELPLRLLDRPMLLASTASTSGDPSLCIPGQQPRAPMHLRFSVEDSTVLLHRIAGRFSTPEADRGDARARQLLDRNFGDPAIALYPVKAYTPDSTALVIEATDLFLNKWKELSPISDGSGPYDVSASADGVVARLTDIRAFDDNIVVRAQLQYKANMWYAIMPIAREIPVPVEATRTLLLLPEKSFTSLPADDRIGVMQTQRRIIPDVGGAVRTRATACRWDLRPADPEAWARGEGSEVAQPIVMYLDPAFPESWKAPVREGILGWNRAFEAIGLRGAIRVEEFPTDDPQFDPANFRYSCIRYAASRNENAEGQAWADPATGEIIHGDIVLHQGVAMQLNKWRFVQTAAVDERVRTTRMPEQVLGESLRYVAAHEMGHVLGLTHNMAASSAYPVDSLRSASFTRQYGLSPSLMDYARFNYVAQPGDQGVQLASSDPGPYDYFTIRWLYTPLPADLPAEAVADSLDRRMALADSLHYRFLGMQGTRPYDPTALEEDLGDDPIRASAYGIANLRRTVEQMPAWFDTRNDPDGEHRRMLMTEIVRQYQHYIRNVLALIGGIRLHEAAPRLAVGEAPGERYRCIPSERQRAAVRWIVGELRRSEWLDSPEVYRSFRITMPNGIKLCDMAATDFRNVLPNVALCSSLSDDPYTQDEYLGDLFAAVWEPSVANRPLTPIDRLLQRDLLKAAKMPVGAVGGNKNLTTPVREETDAVTARMQAATTDADALLPAAVADLQSIEQISVPMLDRQPEYLLREVRRLLPLLRRRVADSPEADRPYYRAMLLSVERMLRTN